MFVVVQKTLALLVSDGFIGNDACSAMAGQSRMAQSPDYRVIIRFTAEIVTELSGFSSQNT